MKHLILVFFSIFLFSTNSFAANKTQLQKWNESPISNVRNQVANQNAGTFSEIPTSQRTIKAIEAKVDTGKVQALIEDKTNYAGSIGKTYVATEIPYSAESAAKTWAKRIGKWGKGGAGGIVGGLILQKFIDDVGWVMDDGSKVIKKPVSSSDLINPTSIEYAWCDGDSGKCVSSPSQAAADAVSAATGHSDAGYISCVNENIPSVYFYEFRQNSCSYTNQGYKVQFSYVKNPYYVSGSTDSSSTTPTQQEIEDAIKDYLSRNPKSQISADLLRYAYTLQDPNGNPTDDPKKADPNNNDSPREITNATNDVLKSNDPLSTGKTNTFPTVIYNNVTNNYNETTTNNDTTNNTTNTTTTEGQSQTDIPPACEYFATLCEWMDWTKKDDLPEKEEIDKEEPKIEEKQVPVNWGAQCPPAETITFTLEGQSIDLKIIDFEYICPQAPIISPLVIFSSTISALYIIFGFGNRSSGGSDD